MESEIGEKRDIVDHLLTLEVVNTSLLHIFRPRLLKEENNLKKRLSITASLGSDDLTGSTDNVASRSTGSSPRQHSLEAKERPIVVKVRTI